MISQPSTNHSMCDGQQPAGLPSVQEDQIEILHGGSYSTMLSVALEKEIAILQAEQESQKFEVKIQVRQLQPNECQ
eukprot:Nitzschia sp. Nitz4//scaffold18_size181773//117716//117943//NITZ4_001929-RA/size181773-processed-gene-0.58-mRNA-1//-1//CDS//3329540053//971//frame0